MKNGKSRKTVAISLRSPANTTLPAILAFVTTRLTAGGPPFACATTQRVPHPYLSLCRRPARSKAERTSSQRGASSNPTLAPKLKNQKPASPQELGTRPEAPPFMCRPSGAPHHFSRLPRAYALGYHLFEPTALRGQKKRKDGAPG